ncbi:MAG: sulfite exporter TauE/SafE family protein, partial [Oleispira sp.]|nr:sulfite exporter TauE/SafE family protein [Oleispira sp.]MBL4881237.1 sulfite exporter TauE/SafE family protein [Oleispira sp.]
GFPPNIAVGTDLMYASVTKASGVISHHRQKHVEWKLVKLLAMGSIPAALITGYSLQSVFEDSESYEILIKNSLGFMLLLTAFVVLFRKQLQRFTLRNKSQSNEKVRDIITFTMGIVLGVLVTLTSVGAGAIGTAVLMLMYPALRSANIVGTDIAHAVPLTACAGLVHMWLGNVDFSLLFALLIGSIPAIQLGSKVSHHLPDSVLKPLLASILFFLGAKYAFFS